MTTITVRPRTMFLQDQMILKRQIRLKLLRLKYLHNRVSRSIDESIEYTNLKSELSNLPSV
jgi:hypothetical protein